MYSCAYSPNAVILQWMKMKHFTERQMHAKDIVKVWAIKRIHVVNHLCLYMPLYIWKSAGLVIHISLWLYVKHCVQYLCSSCLKYISSLANFSFLSSATFCCQKLPVIPGLVGQIHNLANTKLTNKSVPTVYILCCFYWVYNYFYSAVSRGRQM